MNVNLASGLIIMVIGLGTVLLFLLLMIFSMNIMSKTIIWLNKIFPEVQPEIIKNKSIKISDESEIALAIVTALKR